MMANRSALRMGGIALFLGILMVFYPVIQRLSGVKPVTPIPFALPLLILGIIFLAFGFAFREQE
jgi:hypothetical protein